MASEIGVQTIQHTNGTDAMTIDSSGRVNPQPVLHFVLKNNDDLCPAQQTLSLFTFNKWHRTTIHQTHSSAPVAGNFPEQSSDRSVLTENGFC